MMTPDAEFKPKDDLSLLAASELDAVGFPELRDLVLASEAESFAVECRTYPGYPRFALPTVKGRFGPSLDKSLVTRRSRQHLKVDFPAASTLARLLRFAHGDIAAHHRGPVPSAGGLQALELYLATWNDSWLPAGVFHYDRSGHFLSQVNACCDAEQWRSNIPSSRRLTGGALVWIIVGETLRVRSKYGSRADRFLLLEAGHLMQNLCLLSGSVGLVTVPQGACFEHWIAGQLMLQRTDAVLYAAIAG
ncbi:MAG: SagB/ThcOx family dehydrogenase [Planctomycetaceae bacterium]|jgi:SagB-type dehydrogenase family enzyme